MAVSNIPKERGRFLPDGRQVKCSLFVMEISLKNLQKKVPIPQSKILKVVKAAFRKLELLHCGLSIVFVGPKRMRTINKQYLNHDYVTDVLTFDFGKNQQGEIIICPHIAAAYAKAHQTSTGNEIILYVIHGILHLAGFDDHKPKDMLQMRIMENELLKIKQPLG
jgi:probable rRNA maturation factor